LDARDSGGASETPQAVAPAMEGNSQSSLLQKGLDLAAIALKPRPMFRRMARSKPGWVRCPQPVAWAI